MTVLSFPNIVLPGRTISIDIRINANESEVLYPKLLHLGAISIGNPDCTDDEDIIRPAELPLSFQFPVAEQMIDGVFYPSVSFADQKYYNILDLIKQYGAEMLLFNMPSHTLLFRAYFQDELISGDSSTRTISLRFTDELKSLTEPNPGAPAIGTFRYLSDYIKELLPGITDVIFVTDFRFRYNIDNDINGLQSFCYMHQLGALSTNVYHSRFVTKGDILKAILNSFASYGVVGFDRCFYVLPLFFNNAPLKQISSDCIEGGSEVEYGKTYKALAKYYQVCKDSNTNTDYIPGKHAKDARTRLFNSPHWESNPDIKIITSLFSVGEDTLVFKETDTVKRTWATNLYYMAGEGNPRYLFANKVSYKRGDGTYSEERSLHQWAASLILESISGLRRTIKETVPGSLYSFNEYYQRQGIPAIFRPKSISMDFEKDQSTLVLQECINADIYLNPVVTVFNKILRAFEYSVVINRKPADNIFQYLSSEGEIHSTAPSIPYLSGEQVIIKIKNVFNCRNNSAVEYDGIGLSISDDEMGVWNDNWTYLVYIAIGKSKTTSAPASSFPDSDDSSADWFLLASIADNKIDASDYYYQYVTSAKRVQTKNPFWIWVGLKSSSAPLFPGIPNYNK